jgi:hypothetical protein
MNINFLDYYSLVDAIPQKWKRAVKTGILDDNTNSQEEFILQIIKVKQVCRLVHKELTERIIKTPVSELKWAEHFKEWDSNWRDLYLIPITAIHYLPGFAISNSKFFADIWRSINY